MFVLQIDRLETKVRDKNLLKLRVRDKNLLKTLGI